MQFTHVGKIVEEEFYEYSLSNTLSSNYSLID